MRIANESLHLLMLIANVKIEIVAALKAELAELTNKRLFVDVRL